MCFSWLFLFLHDISGQIVERKNSLSLHFRGNLIHLNACNCDVNPRSQIPSNWNFVPAIGFNWIHNHFFTRLDLQHYKHLSLNTFSISEENGITYREETSNFSDLLSSVKLGFRFEMKRFSLLPNFGITYARRRLRNLDRLTTVYNNPTHTPKYEYPFEDPAIIKQASIEYTGGSNAYAFLIGFEFAYSISKKFEIVANLTRIKMHSESNWNKNDNTPLNMSEIGIGLNFNLLKN
jgi:hypothetical protein